MPGAGVFQLSAQGMVVQFSGSGAELPALPGTLGDKLQPGAAAATEGIPQQPKLPSSPRFSAKPPSSADRLRSLQPLHIFFQFPSLANSEQLSFRGKNVLQFLQASPALFSLSRESGAGQVPVGTGKGRLGHPGGVDLGSPPAAI